MTIIDDATRGRIRVAGLTQVLRRRPRRPRRRAGPGGRRDGPAGAQRRRQVHAAADAGHRAVSRHRPESGCSVSTRRCLPSGSRSVAGWGSCPSHRACTAGSPRTRWWTTSPSSRSTPIAAPRRREVARVLEAVGLADADAPQDPHALRAACTSASRSPPPCWAPQLLVLDEPATGLDPEQRMSCAPPRGHRAAGNRGALHPQHQRGRGVVPARPGHAGGTDPLRRHAPGPAGHGRGPGLGGRRAPTPRRPAAG